MKKIFITLLLHFFFVMPSFSLGSIITTRNSYFYAKPNLQSTQYYISTYNSFKVLDIFVDSKGKVFFLVEKNIIRKKKKGIGFVYVNLEDTKEDKVKFFKKIPVKKSDFLSSYQISTEDLKATGKVFSSKDVPFLNWYEVNYNVDFSEKIWAEDRKVAYRPNKSVKWLNQKYQQILSARPVPRKIRDNILVGLVETGFTPEYVILTLEQPSKKNSLPLLSTKISNTLKLL